MTKKLSKIEEKGILTLQVEDRIKKIVNSDDPGKLVAALPEEEAWLCIKKAGPEDALLILSKTTPAQLQYIFDIELWKKDKFLPENALEWLSLIKDCGEKKILSAVFETETELMMLSLKKFLLVMRIDSKDEDPMAFPWQGKVPPHTFDGAYYFQALSQEADDVIRPILQVVARADYDFYKKLCEILIAEFSSNLEEDAFSWRTKRLCDKGFMPFEEALSAYRFISDKQIPTLPKRRIEKREEDDPKGIYPLAAVGESYPLFMLAMKKMGDANIEEEIKLELMQLANRLLIADGRTISPESVESSLKKALGYSNVGLEKLCGNDPDKGKDVLREMHIVHLFQIGYSAVSIARQKAKRFMLSGWPAKCEGDLTLLDETLYAKVSGLLRKRPLCYDGANTEDQFRDFKGMDEVRSAEEAVDTADYIGRMFADVFSLSPNDIKTASVERESFSWTNALLTIFCKGIISKNYTFSPIPEKELSQVVKKMFTKEGFVKKELVDNFRNYMITRQPKISEEERKRLDSFLNAAIAVLIDEFQELDKKADLDWRFVQSVWAIPASA